jgi:SAM-dependent methyltransferase
MAFIDLFSGIAAAYAAARPTYPDALFKRLAALAPATLRAWDCGTGSGQAAIGIAHWFARVDATDASAEQIAHAVPHERVHYSVRTAEASGLPDRSCDLVSVAQALHWFDRPRFFEETRRVLKPSGILAVIGSSWFYIASSVDPVVEEFLLQPIEGYWKANNQLLWDGYRSIEFPFREITPPRLAIHLEWNLDQLLGYYLTWSAAQAHLKAHGDGFLHLARTRLEEVWGEPTRLRSVVLPLAVRVGQCN